MVFSLTLKSCVIWFSKFFGKYCIRRPLLATRNHAYSCIDTRDCTIRPAIVGFPTSIQENRTRIKEVLSSGTVNISRKRKETTSLLTLHPDDTLFTRSIRRRYTPATSNIRRNNTNRNSPVTNIQNLSVNTTQARSKRSTDARDDTLSYMDLGDCDQQCRHCGCLFWYNERLKGNAYAREAEYHLCCGGGQIYMPPTPAPPAFIQQLFKNNQFMKHIQAYNQMFAMTSFGDKIDHSLYVYDTCDELRNRMHHFGCLDESTLNPEIVEGLVHVLDEHNGLVRLFRTARDKYNAGDIPSFKIRLYNIGVRGYELPTVDVLGVIVFKNGPRIRTYFYVIIEFRSGPPQRVNKLHQSYMLFQFPLLFVFGQPGYYLELILKPRDGTGKGKKIFSAIEQDRLDFIRKNQNDLRSDFLLGLYDVVSRGDHEGIAAGSKIMLPNAFTGGPRYMYNHYLDALAICRSLGNPQIFITFTCNVKWPEIKRYMVQFPELTPTDRADIVCRVFEQKVKYFLRFLKEVKTFGYVSAVLYTIEFQKRGLPHCHTLLWIDSRNTLKDATQIDEYISAEIPDPVQDTRGYKLVTELMMHGPCGPANLDASCMQNGPCNKHFPKHYNKQTYFDNNGHTQYRRRDTGIHVMKGELRLDNCNIVPYNRALCLAFEAHINVEYCGWSMLIKYLFKYISKGPDRILAKISHSETSTSGVGTNKQIDEIQNYVDGRFICPFEACWRIFDFPIHCREPAVQILNVHLEDMQRISFRERDRLDNIVNIPEKKKTTLTEWKGLKRQKEAKNDQKPTRNERDKSKSEKSARNQKPDQPDTVKERNKGSQKSNYKSKGQECQVFKESRANWKF
ncbi:DNA helicase [Tanacetum coccineum]